GYRGGGPAGRERLRDRSAARRLRVWTPHCQCRAAPAGVHHRRVVGGFVIRTQRDRGRRGQARGERSTEGRSIGAVLIWLDCRGTRAVARLHSVGGGEGFCLLFVLS